MRALLIRELMLATRAGGGAAQGLVFFLIVVLLVPFGMGPAPDALAQVAPGTLWIAALLSCLVTLDRLFQTDFEDGSLDALALSPLPLEAVVAVKALAHWLTTGLPLTVIAPVLGLTLNLPGAAYPWLIAALLAGTPALSLLGTIGAALVLGLRRGGLLIGVLTLPLYIPTLIFGARTVVDAADGQSPAAALALTAALSCAILAAVPAAVRSRTGSAQARCRPGPGPTPGPPLHLRRRDRPPHCTRLKTDLPQTHVTLALCKPCGLHGPLRSGTARGCRAHRPMPGHWPYLGVLLHT